MEVTGTKKNSDYLLLDNFSHIYVFPLYANWKKDVPFCCCCVLDFVGNVCGNFLKGWKNFCGCFV